MTKPKLILASASPARKNLLEQAGVIPDAIIPADIDESALPRELPKDYVLRVAEAKARKIAEAKMDSFIIAADTIGAVGRRIIGKAHTEEEARQTIALLSGRKHRVYTGLCVITPEGTVRTRSFLTYVTCKRLSKDELEGYVKSHEWQGKSGCYSLQGPASAFITSINGSYTSVIGIPVAETKNMLTGLGYSINTKL